MFANGVTQRRVLTSLDLSNGTFTLDRDFSTVDSEIVFFTLHYQFNWR
jgi:hypothetical protein